MFQIKDGSAKMGKKGGNISPMAYCIFQQENKILLIEDEELSNGKQCYRPLGGEVAFGEYSWETIRREMKKLLGEDVKNLSFLVGPSEVVTQVKDRIRHEIVFLFKGEIDESKANKISQSLMAGTHATPVWKSIKELRRERVHIYPEELLDLIEEN